MKNLMRVFVVVALLVVLPQVTFAAWWNPLSWFPIDKPIVKSESIDQKDTETDNFISKNKAIDIEKNKPKYSIDIQKYVNQNIFLSIIIKDIFEENGKLYIKAIPASVIFSGDYLNYVAILEISKTELDSIKARDTDFLDMVVILQGVKKSVFEIYSDVTDSTTVETYLDPSTDIFILKGKIIDIK